MADFCKQCSRNIFDLDRNDLSGQVSEEEFKQGYVGWGICEGCGGGEFAPDGTCLGGCLDWTHKRIIVKVEG